MAKIVRYEFLGSWYVFSLGCIIFFLLPAALLYLATNMIRIEENLDDPERFVEEFRQGKLTTRKTA